MLGQLYPNPPYSTGYRTEITPQFGDIQLGLDSLDLSGAAFKLGLFVLGVYALFGGE